MLVRESEISYIGLRLRDSNIWGDILTKIFGFKICIVKDYESNNKPIKDIYNSFKNHYKIPINLLNDIMKCKYLNYYYSEQEKNVYYSEWLCKSTDEKVCYTLEQYRLYQEITIENAHMDYIQLEHYMDEGCLCKACNIKRNDIASKLMRGINVSERIFHREAKTELLEKRVEHINKLNQVIQNLPKKVRGKDFKREMSNVLKGNK